MTTRRWTGRRLTSVIVGSALALGSLAPLTAGGYAFSGLPGDDDYADPGLGSGDYDAGGYAAVGDPWNAAKHLFGILDTVRFTVTPADDNTPVFIGLTTAEQADDYLADVEYTTYHEATGAEGPTEEAHEGSGPQAPPEQTDIWVAQSVGAGTQTLQWDTEALPGDLAPVIMNADGSPAVAGHLSLDATVPSLPWIAAALLIGGLIMLAGGVVLIIRPVRSVRRQSLV